MNEVNLSKEFHPYSKETQLRGVNRKRDKNTLTSRGAKLKTWLKIKRDVIADFRQRGITSCEIMLEGCTKGQYLTPAHIDKRRNLSLEEMGDIVVACEHCHGQVEALPAHKMRQLLQAIIDSRKL